jgi:hypothetical protein
MRISDNDTHIPSSIPVETHSTQPGSQPPATLAKANQHYLEAPLSSFLNPESSLLNTKPSASQVESVGGESSSAPSQFDPQTLLTAKHWMNKYTDANSAKGAYGALIAKSDYWTQYAKTSKASGKERNQRQVQDLIPDLRKELEARKNEPSLVLYKSQPEDRNEIHGHFGDYDQAKKYYDGNPGQQQKMMKITLKPGAHELLFSPKYMALSPAGKQHRTIAELPKLNGEPPYPLTKKNGEGFLGGYIGLKAEDKDQNLFSLGIGKNKASQDLFDEFVDKIEPGRPGEDGWEPILSLS